ncbi:2-acylglycerol O-acyltransferase, putative [Phytophthora infestans T30-4]|uniref:Acyltransferase n=1 Tax=Phytophthora infestans (strain T30-4) TaxID=403677 RepID=D0P1L0_PHYIT|nr:2-acylglycerol O-acyltransferase, putative [Phytophthora infestans T30-4]EEY54640.1 2-acylglycerol O-acyltransferase, putative [Phytophthora infestans T30-4]|eukprot:XP_002895811.1 2-acylglycerol O-acyltransferase, putative [Phytophthora infestans T30-4]
MEQDNGVTSPSTTQRGGAPLAYETPGFFSEDSRVPQWAQNLATDLFSFVTIHYNVWGVPFVVLFYYLYSFGYGYWCPEDGRRKPLASLPLHHELDSNKKYIFGFHPHGIIVLSRVSTYGGNWEKVFPGIPTRALGASTMFYVPLGRELCLWLGGVDASRSTADKVLNDGTSIVVYPGGVPEIFKTDPNSKVNELVLKKRLGFVKLAMRHGAELVPSFVFGEKWLYNMWNPPQGVIDFFRKTLRIPMIVFWGKFMWMPKQPPKGKRFGVVYGKPIPTKLTANPSEEEIRAVHTQYVAEIQRLFSEYKKDFGYDDDETLLIN